MNLQMLLVVFTLLASYSVQTINTSDLLPPHSHCKGAFEQQSGGAPKVFDSVFHFNALPADGSTLRAINAGFGTTGSQSVFEHEKARFTYCCHGKDCVPPSERNVGMEITEILKQCLRNKEPRRECETDYFLRKTRQLILEIATGGMQSIGDTPSPYIFRELCDLIPNLEVLHSVREPRTWVMKRLFERYDFDFICDVHKTEIESTVSSPFHILKCMQGTNFIYENVKLLGDFMGLSHRDAMMYSMGAQITSEHDKAFDQIANYFAEFNTIVANTVGGGTNKYTPVCVWDKNFT